MKITDKARGVYKKICIVCGKEFYVPLKARSGKHQYILRSSNCVTCSRKCSNIYAYRIRVNKGSKHDKR